MKNKKTLCQRCQCKKCKAERKMFKAATDFHISIEVNRICRDIFEEVMKSEQENK